MGFLSKIYIEWYWKYRYGKSRHFIAALERQFEQQKEKILFIQIGANEKVGYPLEEFVKREQWSSILIEPDKTVFEKLVHNYSGLKSVKFENVAISSREEEKDFYFVSNQGDAPEWATQLNSLKKEGLDWLKHKFPSVTISSTKMHCVPIRSILNKHNLNSSSVSIIQIDTEGHDHIILKSFDWSQLRPGIIIFEHRHLSKEEYKQACRLLRNQGYNLFLDAHDTLAYTNAIQETLFKIRYEL